MTDNAPQIPQWTFNGLTMLAKVIDVIDGDTIKAAFDIGTGMYWHSIRFAGIDAPELHGPTAYEKQIAMAAREHLVGLVADKMVTLKMGHFDKYGRILATILLADGTDVNQAMIVGGFARPYNGGKRQPWVPPIPTPPPPQQMSLHQTPPTPFSSPRVGHFAPSSFAEPDPAD